METNCTLFKCKPVKRVLFDGTSSGSGTILPLLLILITLIFSPSLAWCAADPFAGKITMIDSGTEPQIVNIVRAGKSGYEQAKPGAAVFIGDTIKTRNGVKAQVLLSDRSTINIGPNATFAIKAYIINTGQAKRNYVLKALKGTMRFIISKAFKTSDGGFSNWRDSNVVVETTTAVAGVRGTDFVVSIDSSKAVPSVQIAVLEGLVRVQNISLSIKEAVTLSANQMTSVRRGLGPDVPSVLSSQQRDALISLTTPAPSQPEIEALRTRKKATKYTEADIRRDLAAGVPLEQVLDRAAEAGMPISEAVKGALDVGVRPYDVVYVAVAEGYSCSEVVSSAIANGAPLQEVVSAAIMGGAETGAVVRAVISTGVSPEIAAASIAIVESTISAEGDYTYSQPVGPTSTVNDVIQPQVTLPAGGGETPSASRSKP